MIKKTILTIALAIITSISFGQENNEYEQTLDKMLQVSGSQESFKGAIKQMLGMYKQQKPDVPEKVWKEVEVELSASAFEDLSKRLVPVYQKHLSLEDLKGIIAFYGTPLGGKYAEKTPMIMTESMQVGQQWGMQLGQKIGQILQEKGH